MRGADVQYSMEIDFLDAVNGGTRQVTLPDGKTLDIRIPPGARDGQRLRLRGKGGAGEGEGRGGEGSAGQWHVERSMRDVRMLAERGKL